MPISAVKVTVNNVETTLTDNGDGTFSGTLSAPNVTSYNVNAGHYYPVTVAATNQAGTTTTVNDQTPTLGDSLKLYVKEVTAPTITIESPTSGQYLSTSTPTIKFQLLDEANGSGVAITTLAFSIDSNSYTNTSQGVSVSAITNGYDVTFIPSTPLTDGEHTLNVSVSDNDGNDATSTTVTFTTDTVAPSLSVTTPATDGTFVADANFTVTGTASDSTSGTPTVTITLNTVDQGEIPVVDNHFSKEVVLQNGLNTIVVTATDLAGKSTTITRTITLDTSSPVIASVNITPNPVNVGQSYTVTITVS